jgi:hypothetical protein
MGSRLPVAMLLGFSPSVEQLQSVVERWFDYLVATATPNSH